MADSERLKPVSCAEANYLRNNGERVIKLHQPPVLPIEYRGIERFFSRFDNMVRASTIVPDFSRSLIVA